MKCIRPSFVAWVAFLAIGCGSNSSPPAKDLTPAKDTSRAADKGPSDGPAVKRDASSPDPPKDAAKDLANDATSADSSTSTPDAGTLPAPVLAVDKARYLTDLKQVARERPPGSNHWQAVQDLCAQRFKQLGYQVTRHRYASGVNVIGRLAGKSKANELVVISAHYDHVRKCNGADDNASGVAGVLEAARVLAGRSYHRSLVVACWDEEERGLIGSKAWVADTQKTNDKVVVAYVFEMIGFKSDDPNSQKLPTGFDLMFPAEVGKIRANQNRGDFIAAIYDQFPGGDGAAAGKMMVHIARNVGLSLIDLGVPDFLLPIIPDLLRSDHAPFWQARFPAIMVTDTANFRNPNYHCPSGKKDDIETIDTDFASQVVQATVGSALFMLDR
jgi:hypothetical protein